MANYTINNLPNTVTELNSADTLAVWDSANSKTAKINGSNLSNSILSNLVTISASSTTVSGLPIKRGSCVKILFTSAITGSDTSTAMAITYNGTSIPVKVGKQGSLSNFVAHEINSAYYYLQAYTTLELIFDGTQFIIVGNPVVLSSSDYTIYADGSKRIYPYVSNSRITVSGASWTATEDVWVIFSEFSAIGNDFNLLLNGVIVSTEAESQNIYKMSTFSGLVKKGDTISISRNSFSSGNLVILRIND